MIQNLKKQIFCIIFMLFSINSFAQNTNVDENFPGDWLGAYKGKMYILKQGKGVVDSVDLKFELLPTNLRKQWVYKMTYKSPKYNKIIKNYLLVKPDTVTAGTYLLDEKDGIIIQQTLIGNTFYSSFSVAGNIINSVMTKRGNAIDFELYTSNKKESLSTKNKAKEGQIIFEVKSFPPFTTQRARLIKIE